MQPAGEDTAKAPQFLVAGVGALVGGDTERIEIGIRYEGPRHRLQRAGVGRLETEQRAGPERGPVGAPEVEVLRAVDRVVLALVMREREADRDALLVVGLSLVRGVRLVELGARLGPVRVLDAREVEEFAGLGGVQDVTRGEGARCPVTQVLHGHRPYDIVVGLGGDRPVLGEHRQPARCPVGREHAFQDGEGDPRLVAELADATRSRVEVGERQGFGPQRVPVAVVPPDLLAQPPVRGGRPEPLHPRVLVGGHGLTGELAADPVRLLGEHDAASCPAGGECGGHATEAAAHDEDVCFRYHASPCCWAAGSVTG